MFHHLYGNNFYQYIDLDKQHLFNANKLQNSDDVIYSIITVQHHNTTGCTVSTGCCELLVLLASYRLADF